MRITNPFAILIGVGQAAAGIWELSQGRNALCVMWVSVAVASFAMGMIQ